MGSKKKNSKVYSNQTPLTPQQTAVPRSPIAPEHLLQLLGQTLLCAGMSAIAPFNTDTQGLHPSYLAKQCAREVKMVPMSPGLAALTTM